MTSKRTKDPAGLLPDRVKVDFTDPAPGDLEAVKGILESNTPKARIDCLRRHTELAGVADSLAKRLTGAGNASNRLLDDIRSAEFKALYLAAAPASVTKKRRIRARQTVSDDQIIAAVRENKTLIDAATYLGITERQLRTRREQIKKRKV